ncbi:hypothetical protein UY3_15768 [Chelonia mydas]|uniref:Uncharacterized protein n=1 Tax=Chelonia mydas TaxID=8469 RepID=M7ARA2_CHEMY|nr:hypothetical protein UY3_15768 [Chelonia mydas]
MGASGELNSECEDTNSKRDIVSPWSVLWQCTVGAIKALYPAREHWTGACCPMQAPMEGVCRRWKDQLERSPLELLETHSFPLVGNHAQPVPLAPICLERRTAASGSRDRLNLRTQQSLQFGSMALSTPMIKIVLAPLMMTCHQFLMLVSGSSVLKLKKGSRKGSEIMGVG